MLMKILNEWTDDHLPCVNFEHEGNTFEIWWTDSRLVGRLEMVEEGDLSLDKALKSYPNLKQLMENPTVVPDGAEDAAGEGELQGDLEINMDAGFVIVNPTKPTR